MVRIRDVAWALAAAAAVLAGSRPASADPIALTGNVASDFTAANGSVEVPIGQKINGQFQYTSGPDWVGVQPTVPNALPSGAFMQNIWFNYNASTDTMSVGLQGFTNANGREILGDMSGNPNAALDANSNPALGPISSPTNSFLGSKSIAITFAPITQNASGQSVMGAPTIIAGIPALKPNTDTPDFMVAHYSANGSGIPFSFGQPIANGGSLAFNTTAATPDFEFRINNFSKISGINPSNGFYIQGFDGMSGSSAGKSQFLGLESPPVPQGISNPEPTTWMVWALLAGGGGWRYRRRLVARG
jgi:hypothetical protein